MAERGMLWCSDDILKPCSELDIKLIILKNEMGNETKEQKMPWAAMDNNDECLKNL